MSQYTPEQRREIMARAHAILAETAPAAQRKPVASRTSGPGLVYKTRVANDDDEHAGSKVVRKRSVETRVADDDGDADLSAAASAYATAKTPAGNPYPWWTWVEKHCEYHRRAMCEAVGQALGEFRAQACEHCEREVGIVKRELELTRRELTVLRHEVGVERGLRDLRRQLVAAQKQVQRRPKADVTVLAKLEKLGLSGSRNWACSSGWVPPPKGEVA
jgi:hypothetical protein